MDADWAGVQARPWEGHACLQDVMRVAVLRQCPPTVCREPAAQGLPGSGSMSCRRCMALRMCSTGTSGSMHLYDSTSLRVKKALL